MDSTRPNTLSDSAAVTPAALRARTIACASSRRLAMTRAIGWLPQLMWRSRLVSATVLASTITCLTTAAVFHVSQRHQFEESVAAQADALVNWLLADARRALANGTSLGHSVDAIERQAAVVSAKIVGDDGRVVAPAARATEVYRIIPVVDVDLSAVTSRRITYRGTDMHVLEPLVDADGVRRGVVWLIMRRAAGPLDPEAMPLLIALGIALASSLLSAWHIELTTMRGVVRLTGEIEHGAIGEPAALTDPWGSSAGANLVTILTRLITRLHQLQGTDSTSDQRNRSQPIPERRR
jgi:hypothetical protein